MRTRVSRTETRARSVLGARWLGALVLLFVHSSCADTGDVSGTEAVADVALDRSQTLLAEADRHFQTRTRDGLVRSLELYDEARELVPSFARAHAGAASAGCLLALYSVRVPTEVLPAAGAAAERALALDPELAEAWAALGLVDYLYRWEFDRAEQRFLKAARLDAGYATVEHWRGMLLMAQSRFDEAVTAYDRAVELDPTSLLFRTKRSTIMAHAGRREEALAELSSLTREHGSYALAWRESGFLALGEGRIEDALTGLETAAELSGGASKSTGGLGYVWGLAGRQVQAEEILEQFVERSASEWVPPMYVALMYNGLGQTDAAFEWLRRAVEARDPGVVYLAVKPGFENLHEDPRFVELLREVGLK